MSLVVGAMGSLLLNYARDGKDSEHRIGMTNECAIAIQYDS